MCNDSNDSNDLNWNGVPKWYVELSYPRQLNIKSISCLMRLIWKRKGRIEAHLATLCIETRDLGLFIKSNISSIFFKGSFRGFLELVDFQEETIAESLQYFKHPPLQRLIMDPNPPKKKHQQTRISDGCSPKPAAFFSPQNRVVFFRSCPLRAFE